MDTTAVKATTTKWTLDKAHAKVGFSITHMLISDIEGSFKNFEVTLESSRDDFSDANIEFTADIKSIDTGNSMRDNHLHQSEFFGAEKNPAIHFKSTSLMKVADKKYILYGDLTFNGIKKSVQLNVTGNVIQHPMNGKTVAGFKIKGEIKRSDFNLGHSFPTVALSDEVAIIANAEFTAE